MDDLRKKLHVHFHECVAEIQFHYQSISQKQGKDLLTNTELSSVNLVEGREEKLYQLGTHDGGPTERADLRALVEQRLGSLHGTDLGPLYVCDNYVAWSLSKTSNRGWEQDLSLVLS